MIVSDNGLEFTSTASWPGPPARRLALHRARQADTELGFVESFNGRMRDELLKREPVLQPRPRPRESWPPEPPTTTLAGRTPRAATFQLIFHCRGLDLVRDKTVMPASSGRPGCRYKMVKLTEKTFFAKHPPNPKVPPEQTERGRSGKYLRRRSLTTLAHSSRGLKVQKKRPALLPAVAASTRVELTECRY